MLQILIALILSSSYGEEMDLNLAYTGRAYPIASQFEANTGYGHLLWGDRDSEPWYGFVRPFAALRGPTAPSGVAGIDLFPISFAGVTVGRAYMLRLVEQPEIDCDRIECLEWVNNTFIQARLYGKYEKFFFGLTYEKTYFDEMDDVSKPVFQSNNGVVQDPRGDRGNDLFLNIGYEFSDDWSGGIAVEYFSSRESHNKQDMQLLFARYLWKNWSFVGAVGRYYSTPLGVATEGTFSVIWDIEKRLGYK